MFLLSETGSYLRLESSSVTSIDTKCKEHQEFHSNSDFKQSVTVLKISSDESPGPLAVLAGAGHPPPPHLHTSDGGPRHVSSHVDPVHHHL